MLPKGVGVPYAKRKRLIEWQRLGDAGGGRRRPESGEDARGERRTDEDGGGNSGVPGPIPTAGRPSSARRRRQRRQRGSGRPASTAGATTVAAGMREWRRRLRIRVRAFQGEQHGVEEREEHGIVGGPPLTDAGRGGSGRGVRGGSSTAAWRASGATVATGEKGNSRKPPASIFYNYQVVQNSLWNLIEAIKHFIKFSKNSCGLHLACKCSTKIGVAIEKV